jgi:SAM-dependent methyltransferase
MVKSMSAWGSGYVTDLEYANGFYREQAPEHLRLMCLLCGVEPPALDAGFTYCELGCGTGITSLILAAANPEARFVAVDFNPSHILYARRLARASGLNNIEFHEAGFDDLVNGRGPTLPAFDFITLHGVYSWVAPGVRASIVQLIEKTLKPGGIVYVSYNAMPGWAACLPVQRLLYDVAELGWERSDSRMQRAVGVLAKLNEAEAAALKNNVFVKEILKYTTVGRHPYLVHEYLNGSWAPQYHVDVARDLAAAKLTYVGQADPITNYLEFILTPAQREIVMRAESSPLRETLLDLCIDRRFRQDVFIRGYRRMSPPKQAALLRQVTMALMVPRSEVKLKLTIPAGEAELPEATFGPMMDALEERPRKVGDLLDLAASKAERGTPAAEVIAILMSSKQAFPLKDDVGAGDQAIADRLNRVLLDQVEAFDPNSQIGLAVADLGGGLSCSFVDALVLRVAISGADNVVERAAAEALRLTVSRGDRVLRDGKAVENEEEALEIVRNKVRQVTATKLPVWQKLLPQLRARA